MYLEHDWEYLHAAFMAGGACIVSDAVHRGMLQRLGYMTPCKPSGPPWLHNSPHHMALTKKGQQRAQEIHAQIQQQRESWKHQNRGAAGSPMIVTGKVPKKPIARSTIPRYERHRVTGTWKD